MFFILSVIYFEVSIFDKILQEVKSDQIQKRKSLKEFNDSAFFKLQASSDFGFLKGKLISQNDFRDLHGIHIFSYFFM